MYVCDGKQELQLTKFGPKKLNIVIGQTLPKKPFFTLDKLIMLRTKLPTRYTDKLTFSFNSLSLFLFLIKPCSNSSIFF